MHLKGMPVAELALAAKEVRRTYSVAEVADMYGVHPATIYREIKAGRLRAMRIGAKGGVVRVPVSAVEEYETTAAVTE